MFMGIAGELYLGQKVYPRWMYKEDSSPLLVNNCDEEEKARLEGYDTISAGSLSNPYLINWFWDLEDFSAKQIHVFALEEYGVDLPIEAGQEKLFKAVCELTRAAPQNRNRLVLMAHTMKLNYDETLEEIRRTVSPGAQGVETETTTFEVEM